MKKTIAILFGALLVSNVAFASGTSKTELTVRVNVVSTCNINNTLFNSVLCSNDNTPFNVIQHKSIATQAASSPSMDFVPDESISTHMLIEVQQSTMYDVQTITF